MKLKDKSAQLTNSAGLRRPKRSKRQTNVEDRRHRRASAQKRALFCTLFCTLLCTLLCTVFSVLCSACLAQSAACRTGARQTRTGTRTRSGRHQDKHKQAPPFLCATRKLLRPPLAISVTIIVPLVAIIFIQLSLPLLPLFSSLFPLVPPQPAHHMQLSVGSFARISAP